MKTSNRILSLLLALAIAFSLVIPTATPVSAAGVDTYIASCTAYAASLQVKTTTETPLMTYPCTTATQSGSSVYETLAAGTALHVTKLYKNTAGEYWYAVSHNLTTCYVKASDTTMLEHLVGDVTATGVMSPASLAYGDAFSLEGNITSSVNKLGTITASMYHSSNLTKAPVITASDTPSGNSYSLKGSTVDYNMAFNALSTGTYTYLLTADAISYYIDDSGKLATAITTVILDKQYAVVTDVDNPNPSTAFGIDVSVHNGYIDWSQAKNDIDFAILRIGWEYTLDTRFLEYAAGCVDNDIPFGVYIYSYAETEAEGIAEAEFVINTLRSRGYNPELPIFFDFEDECQRDLSADLKYRIIRGFCDTIEDAGYQPGVYTFLSWMNTIYTSYFDTLPIWVAQIDGYTSNGTCSFDGGLHMWQYSWTGRISGISSDVDCNLYYADFLGKDADTSYLSQCTAYPSNLTVKTKDSVNLRQYPSTSYSTLKTLSAGTELHVTGVYKNTNGELWYQVIENGTTGYIMATYAEVLEYRYDDISVIKPSMADNINVGSAYSIEGILNSQYNQLNKVYAKIYNGESTLATPKLNSSHTLNDRRYNLYASEVDYNLAFNQLSAGYYTYEISADVKNYYVNASGSLTSVTENVVLWQHPFTVGTVNICTNGHSYGSWTVTKNATCSSEGSKYRTCSNCSVKDTVTIPASSHSYTSVTVPATCKEYAKTTYTCTACGHSYTESGSGMTEWSTTKPTGVAENLIETKTQYRYSDYETKTSYESSLAGYTQVSSAWDAATSGTIQYVKSWPTGYDTSNSLYSTYNKTPKTAGTTTTTKTTVSSDTVTGYIYYHWCTNAFSDGPYNRLIKPTKQGEYTTFHAFYSTTTPGSLSDYDPSDSSYVYNNGDCCMDTYWYFYTEVRTQKYTTQKKLFTYERWTDWSAWSDTAVSTTATRKVETQTLYRYATGELGEHTYNAVVTKPTCSAGGYTTYTCTACGHSYTGNHTPASSHSYNPTVTAPTCSAGGYTTYTCTVCGSNYKSDETAIVDHNYVSGKCSWCGAAEPITELDYYLIGYINGKDYGCESDSANMGTYKFEDGKLTAKFDSDSYVFIKTTNNTNWYMTDGWLGTNTTTATLYNTTLDIEHNKLFVPGGTLLTFTLTVNSDGTLTLSYAPTQCHYYVDDVCAICGAGKPIAQGTCGKTLYWALDSKGVLTITGTGDMYHYTNVVSPGWATQTVDVTKVVIESGATRIGDYAFASCAWLESASIPSTVTQIGAHAFHECESLTQITIPSGVTEIKEGTFYDCMSLEKVILPNSLTKIGKEAFYGCQIATSINIPSTVTSIDDHAFSSCMMLEGIVIPSGLTHLGEQVFYGCEKLTSATIPAGITAISPRTFGFTGLKEITFEGNITSVGTLAFRECSELETIRFTGNAPTFAADTFYGTTATAYYPAGDPTWAADVMQDYDGDITWVAYGVPVIEKINVAFSQIDMGNTLGMRFAFPASTEIDWNGAYVVATMAGSTQTIPATEWTSANIGGTNHYIFGFSNIAAKQMADEITIVIYNADGEAISNEYEDSIQAYVMRNVDKKDAESKALMVDMLNYGAAAQTYYGYNASDLANAQLSETQKAYGTATMTEITDGRVKGDNYLGTRLELGSSIGMQMNFAGTTADMYAVIEFTNHSDTKVSERVAPTEISGAYLIVIDQIVVADGRMPITVTVYNADGTVYGTATDSMASYIARMSNADALYECIMKFSDSAFAYLH